MKEKSVILAVFLLLVGTCFANPQPVLKEGNFGKGVYFSGFEPVLIYDAKVYYDAAGNMRPGNINPDRGTLEFWYKPDYDAQTTEIYHNITSVVDSERKRLSNIYFLSTSRGFTDYSSVLDSGIGTAPQTFSAEEWIHILVTWDKEKGRALYINGVRGNFNETPFTPLIPDKIYIGRFHAKQTRESGADGVIDELRITDRFMEAERIDVPSSPFTPDEHTLFLAHFDESFKADYSKGGNPGILSP